MLKAGEKFFAEHGKPLFSSHMLDLSEETLEENIKISKTFLERMSKIGMFIEIELGVTGGEEDGIYHSAIDNPKLYTQPEHVAYAYEELKKLVLISLLQLLLGMFMAFINLVQLFLNQLF